MRHATIVFASILVAGVCAPVTAGTWVAGTYRNSHGARAFQLYVPSGYADGEKRPLLVGIHGCTETPAEFAGLSRIARLADANRLLVLLPAQTVLANASLCWNWFLPVNQRRGDGEPSLIKGMIDWVEDRYRVDGNRVYVFGVSSGGYLTSTMLSCYPDIFAAGMVASGGMYQAAGDVYSAANAALYGSPVDPDVTGRSAYLCSGLPRPRPVPVLVFHGDSDPYVTAGNGRQVVGQFVQMDDFADDGSDNDSVSTEPLASHEDVVSNGLAYAWYDYGAGGTTLIRHVVVTGMGHAWSGGDPEFPYAEPRGPDQTAIMWDFLRQYTLGSGALGKRRAIR